MPSPYDQRTRQRGRTGQAGGGSDLNLGRAAAIVFGVLLVAILIGVFTSAEQPRSEVPYEPAFLEQVRQGNVESITAQGRTIEGQFQEPVNVPGDAEDAPAVTRFQTQVPEFADEEELAQLLRRGDVVVDAEPEEDDGLGFLFTMLIFFGPVLLIIAVFVYMARRAQGGGGGGGLGALGRFGQASARRAERTQRVSFDDVAGVEESRAELEEIVDFLRDTKRYRKIGARIPHGVLLTGPPGTGKTLLARAVAGEADVPFFQMSASEFVEAIVGVGASRVRDLFKKARQEAPAIVFIDELDAIGRSRSGGRANIGGGANDEREQTLNQILSEMDGFEPHEAVVVLAATNKPDVLDKALLRPGRFDRRVNVPPPDRAGREQILGVHTRSLALGGDVDLRDLAARTPGMVGADLANLSNEAALAAARRHAEQVEMRDFLEALDKVALGPRRHTVLSEEDRRRTAIHEAGHAIVGMVVPGADPVRKVSIVPRGRAVGVTLALPDDDRVFYDEDHLRARMQVALGGRGAEELFLETVSTGAENDLEQVTEIARRMVGRWGMSGRFGPATLLPGEDENGMGSFGPQRSSDITQHAVDEEVQRLLKRAQDEVRDILREQRGRLDRLVNALLEHETLDERRCYEVTGIERTSEHGKAAEERTEAPSPR